MTLRPYTTAGGLVDNGDCTYTAAAYPNEYAVEVSGIAGEYTMTVTEE